MASLVTVETVANSRLPASKEIDQTALSLENEKGDVTPVIDRHQITSISEEKLAIDEDYEGKPTPEELTTLRRVPGSLPFVAYLICAVEFCERASYYGVTGLINNFVNRPLPKGGNGWGAPARGTQQTAGALGMGTVKANAVNQSFNMLIYALPVLFGYLADAKTGRFKLICWGVLVFGISHVLMVGAAAKPLLESGNAKAPYFISVYILAIGGGK